MFIDGPTVSLQPEQPGDLLSATKRRAGVASSRNRKGTDRSDTRRRSRSKKTATVAQRAAKHTKQRWLTDRAADNQEAKRGWKGGMRSARISGSRREPNECIHYWEDRRCCVGCCHFCNFVSVCLSYCARSFAYRVDKIFNWFRWQSL